MMSVAEIGNALKHARFPICSFAELRDALHRHVNVGEPGPRCEIGTLESLLSPRDFLFTNAEQVQNIVQARQWLLIHAENDMH
ncbi:MAG: hypothetical protein Kow0092_24340 [Deferrisomatales bacterium]